jgi:nucleotide-binding universal stress UspA family protein
MYQHVLLPVDDSEAARHAVEEARKWPEGMRPAKLTLLHVLGIYPPALLESGGASTAEEERRQEEELAAKRRAWKDAERERARGFVDAARQALEAAGYEKDRIDVSWVALIPEDDFAKKLLEIAHEHACDRIVLGRGDGKVAEKLQKKADLDVLVVD